MLVTVLRYWWQNYDDSDVMWRFERSWCHSKFKISHQKLKLSPITMEPSSFRYNLPGFRFFEFDTVLKSKILLADGFYYKQDIIEMLKSRGIFTSLRGDGVLASLSQSKSDKWTQDEFFKLVNSLPPRLGLEILSNWCHSMEQNQFCRSLNKEVEIYSSEQLEMIWQLSTGQLLPKILQKCLTQQKRAKLIKEIPRPVFFIAAMAARKNVLFQIIFLRRVFKLLLLFKLCLMEKCLWKP